jgi:hypothetical protein
MRVATVDVDALEQSNAGNRGVQDIGQAYFLEVKLKQRLISEVPNRIWSARSTQGSQA